MDRKGVKMKPVTVLLGEDLKTETDAEAKRLGLSTAAYIRLTLREKLDRGKGGR